MVLIFDFNYLLEALLIVIKATPTTFIVSGVSMLVSLIIGVLVGVIRYEKVPVLDALAKVYVSIFRSTPNIAQIFLFYYGLGQLSQIVNRMNPLVAAIIVLSMNAGAYISESIRGGLISVPSGQSEAGKALGLSNKQIMRKIILPQAFPIALPSLFNCGSVRFPICRGRLVHIFQIFRPFIYRREYFKTKTRPRKGRTYIAFLI